MQNTVLYEYANAEHAIQLTFCGLCYFWCSPACMFSPTTPGNTAVGHVSKNTNSHY